MLVLPRLQPPVRLDRKGRPSPLKCPTVLCVDDAESILKFYEELLSRYGYEVLAVTNGYRALDAFHSRAPRIDAVILDYEMPGMTGLELAILLKGHDPTLPIVMVSGVKPHWHELHPFIDVALLKGVPITDIIRHVDLLVAERPMRQAQAPS
jgi:response regulator RpfG family c-di-GMP phosphodiesterase